MKTFPDPFALPRPMYARDPKSAQNTIEKRGKPLLNVRLKILGALPDIARPSTTRWPNE